MIILRLLRLLRTQPFKMTLILVALLYLFPQNWSVAPDSSSSSHRPLQVRRSSTSASSSDDADDSQWTEYNRRAEIDEKYDAEVEEESSFHHREDFDKRELDEQAVAALESETSSEVNSWKPKDPLLGGEPQDPDQDVEESVEVEESTSKTRNSNHEGKNEGAEQLLFQEIVGANGNTDQEQVAQEQVVGEEEEYVKEEGASNLPVGRLHEEQIVQQSIAESGKSSDANDSNASSESGSSWFSASSWFGTVTETAEGVAKKDVQTTDLESETNVKPAANTQEEEEGGNEGDDTFFQVLEQPERVGDGNQVDDEEPQQETSNKEEQEEEEEPESAITKPSLSQTPRSSQRKHAHTNKQARPKRPPPQQPSDSLPIQESKNVTASKPIPLALNYSVAGIPPSEKPAFRQILKRLRDKAQGKAKRPLAQQVEKGVDDGKLVEEEAEEGEGVAGRKKVRVSAQQQQQQPQQRVPPKRHPNMHNRTMTAVIAG